MDYSIDYSIEFYNLLTNGRTDWQTLVDVKLLPRLKRATTVKKEAKKVQRQKSFFFCTNTTCFYSVQCGGTKFRFDKLNQEVGQCLGLQPNIVDHPQCSDKSQSSGFFEIIKFFIIFRHKIRFFSTLSNPKIHFFGAPNLFWTLDLWFLGSNTYNISWFYAWFWPILAKMLQNQRLDIQILEVFHQKNMCTESK